MTVQFLDVSEGLTVVVDSWQIPMLRVMHDEASESLMLMCGGAMLDIPYRDHERLIWFIANAITVAQGFGGLPLENGELHLVNQLGPHRTHMIQGTERDAGGEGNG